MGAERRQYLRVIFEETIQVRTEEWTDPIATGLDISLNGVRFHCEYSLSDGEKITIQFQPDFELEGIARWCWPIEWYYQAAVQFIDITPDQQEQLRQYIMEVTGEDYPEYEEDEEGNPQEAGTVAEQEESEEVAEDDFEEELSDEETMQALEDDDDLDLELPEDDIPQIEHQLTAMGFSGRQVAILADSSSPHTPQISQYLTERNGLEAVTLGKPTNLWPMLRENAIDLLLMNQTTSNESEYEDVLNQMAHEFPNIPVIILGPPVSLDQRLLTLNHGASDFLTRPVHLSAVSQSILKQFHDRALDKENSANNDDGLLDDNLDLDNELDLMDDEY